MIHIKWREKFNWDKDKTPLPDKVQITSLFLSKLQMVHILLQDYKLKDTATFEKQKVRKVAGMLVHCRVSPGQQYVASTSFIHLSRERMWDKNSRLRKQHDNRDWASNHQPSDQKSNMLTTTPPHPHTKRETYWFKIPGSTPQKRGTAVVISALDFWSDTFDQEIRRSGIHVGGPRLIAGLHCDVFLPLTRNCDPHCLPSPRNVNGYQGSHSYGNLAKCWG